MKESTNSLTHCLTDINGDVETVTQIQLDNECGNGHEDFSLTCSIHERARNGSWVYARGGPAHEHILKLRPELAPFARLHLSNFEGMPMHAAANAFYWLAGFVPELSQTVKYNGGSGQSGRTPVDCRRIFAEHIRATDEQVNEIMSRLPRTAVELQIILEDMNFLTRWKEEASAAIAMLEGWTGKTFQPKGTVGQFWQPVPTNERKDYQERLNSGYYDPEKITQRDAEAFVALKDTKLREIELALAADILKLENKAQIVRYMLNRYYPRLQNFIYYDHTNTVSFNWSPVEKLVTKEEYNAFVSELDATMLPEGLKSEWREYPKH